MFSDEEISFPDLDNFEICECCEQLVHVDHMTIDQDGVWICEDCLPHLI